MMALGTQVWWSAVKSVTFVALGAMVVSAAACGGSGSDSSQPGTASPPVERPRESAATGEVTEKPFVSGGKIDMQLEAGGYTIRPGDGDAIRVTLGANAGSPTIDITTSDTLAKVSVKDTPRNNFQATIDVPRQSNIVIRLTAGELKIESITGDKDIESYAGNVDIVTGDATGYENVEASVRAGDIHAGPFGESQSGLFRSLNWTGKGKYTLRAKLTAGNLTLREK